MKKPAISMLLSVSVFVLSCHAKTRWCSIVGKSESDTLLYPAIARAARVSGVVIDRVTFAPAGKIADVETISGPKMLTQSANDQLKKWTVKTDSSGEDLCQSLVIANFSLDPPAPEPEFGVSFTPSILRISISAEPLVISDPAPILGKKKRRFFLF
ncbi:energy transducer TonB [Alloacidobacterium dinghuense]|uniref:Energy transducer TonB n=1 Tax=Alloacidobacterium dinghuense TaxID=2763107 RepID=A0A7G8BCE1_9BACT|nr:energy transducer TonB [Alloacidobacterium dinghuense]QNI30211.1 energy transducer TonB [Alloacidobacterium dinghuense]